VIFLPLLLDGSGSESQFRRVERLREEPPRVINIDGTRETVTVPSVNANDQDSWWQRMKRRFSENPSSDGGIRRTTDSTVENESPNPTAPSDAGLEETVPETVTDSQLNSEQGAQSFQAYVVQAGSFRDEENALAVRDRLRRAGYPSFVTLSNDETVFRVRVGPMINKDQASNVRENVKSLLGRDAFVMPYP